MSNKPLQDVWDHLDGNKTVGDIAALKKGVLRDEDRPDGVCWACKRFADGSMIHDSPGKAQCCIGCDAYVGKEPENE